MQDETTPETPRGPPATPFVFGDPTLDRDALTDEERRAVGPRRLTSSEWVLVGALVAVVSSTVGAALAVKGPPLDEDRERQAVREVVLRHQFDEAARFVDGDAVFCVALFDGVDPTADFLARFLDYDVPVLPVARCHAGGGALGERRAFLFSVGDTYWHWSGEVDVIAGARVKSRYTLVKRGGAWRIARVTPLAR